jgi:hypothetical protein
MRGMEEVAERRGEHGRQESAQVAGRAPGGVLLRAPGGRRVHSWREHVT